MSRRGRGPYEDPARKEQDSDIMSHHHQSHFSVYTYCNKYKDIRYCDSLEKWICCDGGSLGSESLNWRSAEPEVPPAECNVDPGRSQTHGVPQVPSTSVENRKVESVADHQDYVNFLHTAWNEVTRGQESGVVHMEPCKPPADLLPPLDLKTWIKEREPVPTKR